MFKRASLLILFLASSAQAQSYGALGMSPQFSGQMDASANGYSYSGSYSNSYGMGATMGQTQGRMIDPIAIATAEYLNFNGAQIGGMDARIVTPPIGLPAMSNRRTWNLLYDEARDKYRSLSAD